MNGNLSVIELILGASLIVQLVLVMLLAASIASWAIIMKKRSVLRQARDGADEFEASFWSGGDLGSIYKSISSSDGSSTDMAAIFESGFREYRRLTQEGGQEPDKIIEGSMRAMGVAQMREMDRLDHQLSTLATIGSTSPYVGLFGTVFGIMNSFRALGNVQSATLAMVAPGIAEALIATAMGLFAAIPAVIAYNRYADQVARIEVRYDTFREEFAAILQRSIASRQGPA
ncbi:MAG: protein TolQ [Gammaproteobacteria bacterium]|nr:protein TolQ [Gammaproteobacteria bacterium]